MLERAFMLVGVAVLLAGCATGDQWNTWKNSPAHFASSDHLYFSVRNRDEGAARVTRQDIAAARAQGWWGHPVTVSQEQILDR
jgi:hypothetical protein